ncbi:MAG: 3'-5' exonuclease [Brevibacillus sp.]|uniref:3'-5' exonuclease n=1 Tax=Brevibacillus sp. WF146 TaxID=319501 RepID=UPI000A04429F|nr:3'-5' exonuclease [Brevibacillus sp. WF146]REK67793.1 MAG: 3'-5' exonuclease [Brevibacillus sp.]UYZ13956.1 3'-5' exonuclease [Brevibacillus sp. WF146]
MSETNQLQFFNGRIVCPRCDGNGLVYKAKVSDLNKILYICDECEASWQEDTPINKNSFEDLSTFLEKNGCTYRDANIVDLGYDWYQKN